MNDADAAHLVLRPARDGDAVGFIALIGACWAEYPGCVLDVDGEVPELRALATHFARQGGAFWAAERGGRIVGMVGARPLREDDAWEICRMYVAAEERGSGLAHRLLGTAEEHARGRRAAARALVGHALRTLAPLLREARLRPRRLDPNPRRRLPLARIPLRQAGPRPGGGGAGRRRGRLRRAPAGGHPHRLRRGRRRLGRLLPAARAREGARRLAQGRGRSGGGQPRAARGLARRRAGRHGAARPRHAGEPAAPGGGGGAAGRSCRAPPRRRPRADAPRPASAAACSRSTPAPTMWRRRSAARWGGRRRGASQATRWTPTAALPATRSSSTRRCHDRRRLVPPMAAYNTEMNRRLYAAAAQVPDAESRADRGAFFGSLHSTLSHLVWADHTWMARFAPDGWERLPGGIKESPHLFADWDALCAARRKADAGIEARAAGVTEAWLTAPLTWFSGATGREMTKPCWVTVVHLFNHQTHHRGQAHCLITQRGVKPQDTDLPWVVDLAALGFA